MSKRVLTAVLGMPLLILIVSIGGMALFLAVAVLASIGLWEYAGAIRDDKVSLNAWLLIVLGLCMTSSFYFFKEYTLGVLVFSVMILAGRDVLKDNTNISNTAYGVYGLVYATFFLGHLILLEGMEQGSLLIWLVFLICFGTDTFAYFVGIRFGKNRLAPKISPKKSVEGSIGGLVAGIVLALVYGFYLNHAYPGGLSIIGYGFIGMVASAVSQIGDLAASMIKRQFGIKDFGNLFPGHGGVLDRFDSIIFASPVVYYMILIMTA
ncbi:phosphatidate cytidylyltransferase [Alkalibacter saccharofermentans]|uniref:Phosphatidate cytidylyltransferase n=1 Tax=Alkalibacter saccharofermentans DSM 14828 TaxID=1120975 RepID=A0A1M4S6U1_9FIRM|nr:phosphatidate cytidylyltransferase [Alkalibacter saccharofermentans]SHE27737.1 phosphatidate cytidylyltransferase [Alkalibacter saccharofermentans DSM 14828]